MNQLYEDRFRTEKPIERKFCELCEEQKQVLQSVSLEVRLLGLVHGMTPWGEFVSYFLI